MNAREAQFKRELFELLRKHDVGVFVDQKWRNGVQYADNISFCSGALYDEAGDLVAPEITLRLPLELRADFEYYSG